MNELEVFIRINLIDVILNKKYKLQKNKCNISEVKSLSHDRLFATPWTITYQNPLSMGFCRQEYWSGLPFPSTQRSNPGLPHLQADALPSEPPGKAGECNIVPFKYSLKCTK